MIPGVHWWRNRRICVFLVTALIVALSPRFGTCADLGIYEWGITSMQIYRESKEDDVTTAAFSLTEEFTGQPAYMMAEMSRWTSMGCHVTESGTALPPTSKLERKLLRPADGFGEPAIWEEWSPHNCSQTCEANGTSVAAMRGVECYCLLNMSGLTEVDAGNCRLPCTVWYFEGIASLCGGSAWNAYSLYRMHDFVHTSASGCADPWRRIWYQSVAMVTNESSNLDGFTWYLQASSVDSGEALFPYHRKLSSMLIGMKHDFDESRVVGLSAPPWGGKPQAEPWLPKVEVHRFFSQTPKTIYSDSFVLPLGISELSFMGTGVTALDILDDVYYVASPVTPFVTRIYGIDLITGSTAERIILNEVLPFRILSMEANSQYHGLFAMVTWSGSPFDYVNLGFSYRNYTSNFVNFTWTYSNIYEARVPPSEPFGNWYQIGTSAIDHYENTTFFMTKERAAPGTEFRVVGMQQLGRPPPVVFTPLTDTAMQSSWLANLDPVVPMLPRPKPISAHFSLDGLSIEVRWPDEVYGGVWPADTNGDVLPDYLDWSRWQSNFGNESYDCSMMFGTVTADYVGNMPVTNCSWQGYEINMSLSSTDMFHVGDYLYFKDLTIFEYRSVTRQVSAPASGNVSIDFPDPLLPPVTVIRSTTFLGNPVGMCQPVRLDTSESYYVANKTTWVWWLESVTCRSIGGFTFSPHNDFVAKVIGQLTRVSEGSNLFPKGHDVVDFLRDDLEPGCTYNLAVNLTGRWNVTTYTQFSMFKGSRPENPSGIPLCPIFCNVATCEPPSKCDMSGFCECGPDLFGLFCTGICPPCSPIGSEGCDSGRLGSGTCICLPGWTGKLCQHHAEWRPTEFGECYGPCNGIVGFKNRTVKCVNVETGFIVEDSFCAGTPPPSETAPCTPPLCDCGPPPSIPGGDTNATAAACPSTLSSGICVPICLPNYVLVGKFRCYAGSFIEEPTCSPAGELIEAIPALSVVMTLEGLDAALLLDDAQSYVEDILAPPLKSTVSNLLNVTTDDISVSILEVSFDNEESGRRLALTGRLELTVTVALSNAVRAANAAAGEENWQRMQLLAWASDPSPLAAKFALALTESCVDVNATECTIPRAWKVTQPVSTQVYRGNATRPVPSPLPLPSESPQVQQLEQQSFGTSALLGGIAIGFCAGGICLAGAVAYGLSFDRWKRRRVPSTLSQVAGTEDGPQPAPTPKRAWDLPPLSPGGAEPSPQRDHVDDRSPIHALPAPEEDSRLFTSRAQQHTLDSERRGLHAAAVGDAAPAAPDQGEPKIRDIRGKPLTGHVQRTAWPDGGSYEGQVLEGERNGDGIMYWPNGKNYAGRWSMGQLHGHGLLHSPGERGWVYNGEFQRGRRHGLGRCEWPDRGSWYDGDWLEGLQGGLGEASTSSVMPPAMAPIWRMERGHRRENVSVSPVAPSQDGLIKVTLEATEMDIAACHAELAHRRSTTWRRLGQDSDAELSVLRSSDHHLVAPLWGVAIGKPEEWVAGKWGALIIVTIVDGGCLARWNRIAINAPLAIRPNALVWSVNGVAGDARQMLEELLSTQGRQRITLEVRNPPCMRFGRLRQALGLRPPGVPPPPPGPPPGRPPGPPPSRAFRPPASPPPLPKASRSSYDAPSESLLRTLPKLPTTGPRTAAQASSDTETLRPRVAPPATAPAPLPHRVDSD